MSELLVEFCALRGQQAAEEGAADVWAGGVVITEIETAKPVHAAGDLLPDAEAAPDALYRAMLQALSVIEELDPAEVELRCDSPTLVEQLTGGGAIEVEAGLEALFEQAMLRLLRLGLWRIRCVETAELHRPRELAEQTLTATPGVEPAPTEPEPTPDSPAENAAGNIRDKVGGGSGTRWGGWSVVFAEDAGKRCPMDCRARQRFHFGPGTPEGFCIQALPAIAEDGPLTWDDPQQQRMTTQCPHCDVPMDIEKTT
ncbi:MAG: hypothetical protein WD294_16515 [Phycisphaeraceae bacterium]